MTLNWRQSAGSYRVRAEELAPQHVAKQLRCRVFFLDNSAEVFQIDRNALGQALFDKVFEFLELGERDYFGLLITSPHVTETITHIWLEPSKPLRKQLKDTRYELTLRVKFYPPDPARVTEEYTRYQLVLQLREDLLHHRLNPSTQLAVSLAASVAQAEYGDWSPDNPGYLVDFVFSSDFSSEKFQHDVELQHQQRVGQTPAVAEIHFLQTIVDVPRYGLWSFAAHDHLDQSLEVAVSAQGIFLLRNGDISGTYAWTTIVKLSFKKRYFSVHVREEKAVTIEVVPFQLATCADAKCLWKLSVEHHTFFRLKTTQPIRRGGAFTRSFRLSGRTEYQAIEEAHRKAAVSKSFIRASGKRSTVSGASMSSATLPRREIVRESFSSGNTNGTTGFTRASPLASHESNAFAVRANKSTSRLPDVTANRSLINGTAGREYTASQPQVNRMSPQVNQMSRSGGDVFSTEAKKHEVILFPDEQGRYGFNVKGGRDQGLAFSISRVADDTPAARCSPRLCEGDVLLAVNGDDCSGLTHEEMVALIKTTKDSNHNKLTLTIVPRANSYSTGSLQRAERLSGASRSTASLQRARSVGPQRSASQRHHNYNGPVKLSPLTVTEAQSPLETAITQLERALGDGGSDLSSAFENCPRLDGAIGAAHLQQNVNRNRYRDIAPYDTTRVVLKDSGTGDYINASHVKVEVPGSGVLNRYICAQGPLPHTVPHFWQLLWEQGTSLVVMLCNKVEAGRSQCEQYWPDLYETADIGRLQVTCLRELCTDAYIQRELTAVNMESNEERRITQLQYTGWPDHGIPESSNQFIDFLLYVRRLKAAMVESTVVHCSAGIGRTGVLLLVETVMCLIEASQAFNLVSVLLSLRRQRPNLIQTKEQFRFSAEAIVKMYREEIVKPLDFDK